MLEALGEVQAVRDEVVSAAAGRSGRLRPAAVLEAQKAQEIASMAMGPDSRFAAAASVLVCNVSAAVGDFRAGRQALQRLQECKALEAQEQASASASLNSLLALQDPAFLFSTGQWASAKLELAEDVSQAILSACKDGVHQETLDTVDAPRVLLARAICAQKQESATQAHLISQALDILDARLSENQDHVANRLEVDGLDAFSLISTYCIKTTEQDELRALRGIALGLLARELHTEGQAVSSEGLYRSALQDLESVSEQGYLRFACTASLGLISEQYGLLLDDWENRANDAHNVRKAHPLLDENQSHAQLVLGIAPWSLS